MDEVLKPIGGQQDQWISKPTETRIRGPLLDLNIPKAIEYLRLLFSIAVHHVSNIEKVSLLEINVLLSPK